MEFGTGLDVKDSVSGVIYLFIKHGWSVIYILLRFNKLICVFKIIDIKCVNLTR